MRKKSSTLVCRLSMCLTTKTPEYVVPAYNLPRERAVEAAQKIAEAEAPHAAQAAQAPEGRVVVRRELCRSKLGSPCRQRYTALCKRRGGLSFVRLSSLGVTPSPRLPVSTTGVTGCFTFRGAFFTNVVARRTLPPLLNPVRQSALTVEYRFLG
jgi:hypothetical protein